VAHQGQYSRPDLLVEVRARQSDCSRPGRDIKGSSSDAVPWWFITPVRFKIGSAVVPLVYIPAGRGLQAAAIDALPQAAREPPGHKGLLKPLAMGL
jgi:hypothetical protein